MLQESILISTLLSPLIQVHLGGTDKRYVNISEKMEDNTEERPGLDPDDFSPSGII